MISTLTLSNISKAFGQEEFLFASVSYQFKQGHSYAITGVSGTGKSTLLALLAGIEKPTNGTVFYNGDDLEKFRTEQKQRYFHKIGLIFQTAHLLRELSVIQNVALGGMIAGIPTTECKARAGYLLGLLGMSDKSHLSPSSLSGGEQQRVALGRALFLEPDFLLADEPTAHLDDRNRILILSILKEYQSRYSMGIILTTHDPDMASAMDTILSISYKTVQIKDTGAITHHDRVKHDPLKSVLV